MKWEDTVKQQIYPQTHEEHLASLQNQAKISFKAGAVNEGMEVGLWLQKTLSACVNKTGFNEYRLSDYLGAAIEALLKGQALKEEK